MEYYSTLKGMHLGQFLELDETRAYYAEWSKSERERQISYINVHIWKRWQEYTEEVYEKDLQDSDNHDAVITHLEPDILECEVKWALGSITKDKASGGDRIPVELFQILKDDAVKMLHSICQQIWKTQQYHRTGKGPFSFQSGNS